MQGLHSLPETEISPSVTNVRVHSHTPDDIVFSILSKLSLKSFKRFECVCKSWSLLFDDPYFMNIYRKSFLAKDSSYYDDDASLLLLLTGEDYRYHLYSLSGERFENRIKLEFPNPFPEDSSPLPPYLFEILGSASINGILCIHYDENINDDSKNILILWNPATKEFKKIPSSNPESISSEWSVNSSHYLFGYDRVKDDYKVVQISHGIPQPYINMPNVSCCDIYSLRSKSWKKMDLHITKFYGNDHTVYTDGVCHWWSGYMKTPRFLMSFDFSNDSFITTHIPLVRVRLCTRQLMILNGSIALTLYYEESCTFHILILGEIGVKESWTKLFVIGPLPFSLSFIGARKKGKILFMRKDFELVWFDLSTGMIDEIGLKSFAYRCDLLIYRKSILPIREIYN